MELNINNISPGQIANRILKTPGRPGWPQIHRFTRLGLLSSEIKGMCQCLVYTVILNTVQTLLVPSPTQASIWFCVLEANSTRSAPSLLGQTCNSAT